MMDDLESRIIAHLVGEESEDDARMLSDWIRESPANAQEFARIALMHGQLRNLLVGERLAEESGALKKLSVAETAGQRETNPVRRRTWAVLGAMAFAALIAVGLHFGMRDDDADPANAGQQFATIVQTSDAEWGGDSLRVDDRVGAQTLDLQAGIVRIQLDTGVDVTLEGPARYRLLSNQKTELVAGVLVATVPPGAEGFTVDTPSAQVIDLGTSFGVEVGNGVAEVLVFDGEVEVVPDDESETQRLTEGQSVRLSVDGPVESTEFNASRFEKLWPISSGIVGSTESFRFLPPWPKRIRFVKSDSEIFVATEGPAVALNQPLRTNISEPGRYTSDDDLTPHELPVGERVRSYILHYFPRQERPPRRANRVFGSITFARPVLGLIVRHDELLASSYRFSPRTVGESHPRRQLEFYENGDRITLSEDRRTVTLDVISPFRTSDLVRVIVDAP